MSLEQIVAQFDPLLASFIGGKPGHRAAIWGQALQESNFNPAAEEMPGTNKGGIGLWQHTGSRRLALVRFAQDRGKQWQDAETQIRFTASELLGPESHAWAQTQKTSSIEAATETAMLDFERPAVQGGPPTYGTARLDRRIDGAKRALAVILSQQGIKPMPDTPAQPSQTEQQLATAETQLEAAGNQFFASRLPGAAPIVQLIETSIVNPMLPSLNHAFGAQIDSNAVAHGVFNLVVLGLGFLASRFTTIQPKV
jgi:hypothetical protein